MAQASLIQLIGAAVFGIVIGWYLYHLSRHRAGDIKLRDLITVIGAIGGGGVLALFPQGTDLFGAYGLGLGDRLLRLLPRAPRLRRQIGQLLRRLLHRRPSPYP